MASLTNAATASSSGCCSALARWKKPPCSTLIVVSYSATLRRSACRSKKPMLLGPPAFDGVSRGPTVNSQVTASVCPSRWQVEHDIQKFCVTGNAVELAL